MKNWYIFIFAIALFSSCTKHNEFDTEVRKSVIISVFRKAPSNIHEEINPKYYAVTEHNDTVPCGRYARVGETLYFINYKLKNNDKAQGLDSRISN